MSAPYLISFCDLNTVDQISAKPVKLQTYVSMIDGHECLSQLPWHMLTSSERSI